MRLKDLVHRSALRNRAAGDVEVGGSSAQVFEVADLTIPAGTDWSSGVGHQLGTLTDGLHYSKFNLFEFFIELAEDPLDDVVLDALDDPDFAAYSLGAYLSFGSGGAFTSNNALTGLSSLDAPSDGASAGLPAEHAAIAWRGAIGQFAAAPLYIGLHTNDVTTADITVVRARVAFLVI